MFKENYEDKFIAMIVQRGLEPPKQVIADGKLHRFSSNGKRSDKSGYYVLFNNPDGSIAGKWGCWRSQETEVWSSKGNSKLTTAEKLELQENKRKACDEIAKMVISRTNWARTLLDGASPANTEHPYLQKKGIFSLDGVFYLESLCCSLFFSNPDNTRTIRNVLIIPISDLDGNLLTLQAISEQGDKMFMAGGKMEGGTFVFYGCSERIYVAEGFATAGTVHQATGATVVCAFNANNLKVVAPLIKDKYPESIVIVAADNDHQKEREGKGNKGLDVAKELFDKEQIAYTSPDFNENNEGTDWNDYALLHGIEQVSKAMEAAIIKTKYPITSFEQAIEYLSEDSSDTKAYDEAIRFIKDSDLLHKSRMMQKLKDVTGVPYKDFQSSIRQLELSEQDEQLSHGEIAHSLIDEFSDSPLVAAYGLVWSYNSSNGLWESTKLSHLGDTIANNFNSQDKCQRVSDYKAIAGFVYDLQEEQDFFDNAPHGITTPTGYLYNDNIQVDVCAFSSLQRSRHGLSFDPAPKGTLPMLFLKMLREAFEGCYPDEQIRQLRMVLGLSLFGLLPKHQMAVLLHGAGGSGKSIVLKVLENLVSTDAIATVSPMQMDRDYKVATLAGKRFNLVPELDKDTPIPSSAFKAIIGNDTINAREPYGKCFNFTPTVSNWFNGNFFPKTTDHTFGFYRRWNILHFENSKPVSERDPFLLDRILANELPAILTWAIEGVEDYLQQSHEGEGNKHCIYLSPAHHKYLAKWMAETDSVKGWLNDEGENGILKREKGALLPPLKLSVAYCTYKDWCITSSIKPYSKTEFAQNMEMCGYVPSKPQNIKTYMELSKEPNNIDVLFGKIA
ncbi:hypothetical protein EGH82_23060 [Vibrio ponticus]|uniref:SF3 helicase domain-containing protein n=1 Tax=Vibrio ponticus TaxID=265668 RepID=A0A3N3DRV7_9VIBR|nr:phage/plasmid primase, P4 family [Vibrio ponticus]ROV57119.1 hypothetical protein EGH82_23060 [Vibrio ponticus]